MVVCQWTTKTQVVYFYKLLKGKYRMKRMNKINCYKYIWNFMKTKLITFSAMTYFRTNKNNNYLHLTLINTIYILKTSTNLI